MYVTLAQCFVITSKPVTHYVYVSLFLLNTLILKFSSSTKAQNGKRIVYNTNSESIQQTKKIYKKV